MKISTIILSILILVILMYWCILKSPSSIQYNIENFLVIHTYIKRSFYRLVTLLLDPKKSIHEMKVNMDRVDGCLIHISKKFTKKMTKYIRGEEIMKQMKEDCGNNEIDLFVFPDTFLQMTDIDYYRVMVEKVYEIFDKPVPKLEMDNYKLVVESLI